MHDPSPAGAHRPAAPYHAPTSPQNRRPLPLAVMLAIATLLLVACGGPERTDSFGTITVAPGTPVVVGLSVALTGDSTGDARRIEQGVRLALEESGEVKGHTVNLMMRDDRCSGEGSLAAARDFVATSGLAAVIGPMCSQGCVPAAILYDEARITMLTPSCTGSAVTFQGLETVYRIAPNDVLQTTGQARFATGKLGAKRVYAVNDRTIYARDLRIAFKENLERRGGRFIGDEAVDPTEQDFSALVERIRSARPDLVYFAGFPPGGALLLRQITEEGIETPFMGSNALWHEAALIGTAGDAAEGAYVAGTRPLQGRRYEEFAERYAVRWGEEPGPYSAEGYDAARVLLRALAKAVEERDGALAIDQRALRDAVARTDYQGASGHIQFRPNGDRVRSADALIARVRNGSFEIVGEFTVK